MTAAAPRMRSSGVAALAEWLREATPAVLFGLRLWASVCLSLWVAFSLQLNEPSWAATTAALVCQPVLGASLRKAAFRMLGTVVGAIAIVILAAICRQDRLSFLVGLALWCAGSAFVATLLRNFAAYAAALAGYTTAILAIDVLGPVGSTNSAVLTFAIYRAVEICVGIVSAGVVLALTDLGRSRKGLAREFASLSTAILEGFAECFRSASPDHTASRALRREAIRRVIALYPMIDAAIGEASDLRYRSAVLQRAVAGLMETISAWRKVAFAIALNGDATTRSDADAVHAELPLKRLSPGGTGSAREAAELREACCRSTRSLTRFNAETPIQRLLADNAAIGMLGMARALNGLAGVVDPRDIVGVRGTARLRVPDWLPAFVNAVRVFVTVGTISLFWIASAWPSGATAITFCAVVVVLLSLQGDLAYSASITFLYGTLIGAVIAAILVFGILPGATSFPSLCLVLGLALAPLGFLIARARNPLLFFAASVNLLPMLSITNGIAFDASQFWNTSSAIIVGIAVGAIAMLIFPQLSPAFRTQRLLKLTLSDLRRLARSAGPGSLDAWHGLGFARLLAMPQQAQPAERAELFAVVAVGKEIVRLRSIAPRFVNSAEVEVALAALAEGRSREASARLGQIDRQLAILPSAAARSRNVLRLRASLLAICDQLGEFAPCFDGDPIR